MRFLTLLATVFITCAPLIGAQHTFILHDIDADQTLIQEGDVSTYLSPYCSFNIALSLIGFDTSVLQDAENPVWPFLEEYRSWNDYFPEKWAAPHNPTTWMQHSCLWYSKVLTQKLGMKTLCDYVTAFHYGNQNLTGDPGLANGLTNAWIGSSLRISPSQQLHFINRLVKHQLPVSERAHALAKEILFVETLPLGIALYGKTGGGLPRFWTRN